MPVISLQDDSPQQSPQNYGSKPITMPCGTFCNIAWSCIAAALVAIVSDLLSLGTFARYRSKSHLHASWDDFKQLEPELIQSEWELRRDLRPLETAASLFNAAGWVVLAVPVVTMIWILSKRGQHLVGLHTSMLLLTVGGVIVEMTSIMLSVGAVTAMEWLSTDFNLAVWLDSSTAADPDDIGWRALEVVYLSVQGMHLWVGSMEMLFLATLMVLLFFSIRRQYDFYDASGKQSQQPALLSSSFGYYSLLIGALLLLDFCFEVLRFVSWRKFSKFAFGVSILLRLLLWPAWLLWLGRQLARYAQSSMLFDSHSAPAPSLSMMEDVNNGGASSFNNNDGTMQAVPVTDSPSFGTNNSTGNYTYSTGTVTTQDAAGVFNTTQET